MAERYSQSAQSHKTHNRTLEINPFHKPTTGMRLGLSKVAYRDRAIAEQVAIVIDDLLLAVESNKRTIDRSIPIVNKVRRQHQEDEEKS